MTAPYSPKVLDLLPGSLRHECNVTAVTLDGTQIPLDVEDSGGLSITFDESWAPYGALDLTAAVPSDVALLDLIDPRKSVRIIVNAGYTYPDNTTEIAELADFGLRDRDTSRPDNTFSLTATTDEARAQDQKVKVLTNIPRTGVNEAAAWAIGYSTSPDTPQIVSSFPANSFAADLADMEANHGEEMWSVLDDIAARTGVRIWCDESRVWRIAPRPEKSATPTLSLTVGQNGTLTESNATLSRDDWANSVLLVHRWTVPGEENERKILGSAHVSSGEFATGTVGSMVYEERSEKPISQATANRAAASKLKNLVTRGRSYDLTAAAAYWVRPGQTIEVQLVTGDPEMHIIRSVTFDPLEGLMRITTRQPIDVVITEGE